MNSVDSGIYSITSKINGKRYIGSAIRICKRWQEHLNHLKNNKHHCEYLQRHYNKYGPDDLIFTVLETVERNDLTLEEHRQQLLKIEQTYLDNWSQCDFNGSKIAGSTLGYKNSKSKYYYYNSRDKTYQTFYSVQGKCVRFTPHLNEEAAIKEVEYIKTLTDHELLDYKKECLARPVRDFKVSGSKYYSYSKSLKLYLTFYMVNKKYLRFSSHYTEEEAIKEVEYIKTLNEEQLNEYYKQCKSKPAKKIRGAKNYCFNKRINKWTVIFTINSKHKFFGNYLTEAEAIEKVKQIKLEFGIE
jgi:group I intron endonuclease